MRKLICLAVLLAVALCALPALADGSPVHHIVLFKMKDNVTPEQMREMKTVGEALLENIPGVEEVSINKKAREDRDEHIKDYDLGMYVKWNNNQTGDAYAPDILHQSFMKLYGPLVKSIKVIDFYGK